MISSHRTFLRRFAPPAGFLRSGLAYLATLTLVAGGLAVSAASAAAQQRRGYSSRDYRSRIDTTIAFDKNGIVNINAGSGEVIITGGNANTLRVRAVSDDDDIRFEPGRNSVELSTARRGSDTRFEVTVPLGAHVIARSQSGDISVRGTHGEVSVTAQSGDIVIDDVNGRLEVRSWSGEVTASNITGNVDISTQSGDLKLTDVRGDIEVSNTSGDITLRGVTAKLVRAKTTSGDVIYDGIVDASGRYEFTSHSGDVELHVPRDASAQLTVSTWSGEIESDFPMTLKPGDHSIGSSTSKQFTFAIGGGNARISAETFSGDVTVSSNGRGAATRP
jgi:DUF4097 and DUF4098 domain-containing protein YvlB